MSLIEIKMAMDSFFAMDFLQVGVIALFILGGIYLLLKMQERKYGYQCSKTKMVCAVLLAVYVAFLIGGTVFNRGVGKEPRAELIPFWSYIQLFREKNLNLLRQMISNVLVFIPWPILFATVFPRMRRIWCAVGSAFVFSALVETLQLVFQIGLFEFDDMFHNTLGALIGYGILIVFAKLRKKGK